jgi:small basic protein
VKKVTTFLFVVLNGTWALMAYLLHKKGVHSALIATVVAIGVLFGNLAVYASLRLAEKLLSKRG